MKYTIRYNTGAGDFEYTGDLARAKTKADQGAAYTQQPIAIENNEGNTVAARPWVGCLTGVEDQVNPLRFGDFGYYADWSE